MADREQRADLPDIVFAGVTLCKEGEYPKVVLIDVYFFRHMSIFLIYLLIGVVENPGPVEA